MYSSWYLYYDYYAECFLEPFKCSQPSYWLYILEGSSWSWSYGSRIYNYLCNQCLSPLTQFKSRSGEMSLIQHYVISLSVTCRKLVVFSRYSGFCDSNRWWYYCWILIQLNVPMIQAFDIYSVLLAHIPIFFLISFMCFWNVLVG